MKKFNGDLAEKFRKDLRVRFEKVEKAIGMLSNDPDVEQMLSKLLAEIHTGIPYMLDYKDLRDSEKYAVWKEECQRVTSTCFDEQTQVLFPTLFKQFSNHFAFRECQRADGYDEEWRRLYPTLSDQFPNQFSSSH